MFKFPPFPPGCWFLLHSSNSTSQLSFSFLVLSPNLKSAPSPPCGPVGMANVLQWWSPGRADVEPGDCSHLKTLICTVHPRSVSSSSVQLKYSKSHQKGEIPAASFGFSNPPTQTKNSCYSHQLLKKKKGEMSSLQGGVKRELN